MLEAIKRYLPLHKNNAELVKLAMNNNSEAQYQLGMVDLLDGPKQSYAEALDWLKKSAKQNNPKALYALGSIYQFGELDQAINMQKAKDFYQKAVDAGDNYAPSQLASLLSDEAKSLQLNQLGASRGDYEAMYHLGRYYFKKADVNKASDWFLKSLSAQPNMCAANDLATLYSAGKGVKKDINKANDLYTQAVKMMLIEKVVSDATRNQITPKTYIYTIGQLIISKDNYFGIYQTAQAQHQDISEELNQRIPPEVVEIIQEMSKFIENKCK